MTPLEQLAAGDERVAAIRIWRDTDAWHMLQGKDVDYLLNLAASLYQQNQQAREMSDDLAESLKQIARGADRPRIEATRVLRQHNVGWMWTQANPAKEQPKP